MENTDEIRKKIARLIREKGYNYARVSLAIGKNIAYIQQFIKNGSPRRLGEVERKKMAALLQVDEQELTDLPLQPSDSSQAVMKPEILALIIEKIEHWLVLRNAFLSPRDKAELIKLIYLKVYDESVESAQQKVNDFIDIYDELRKAN
ncbi:MAG: hypothetical protein J6Y91_02155 [Alphaproteobacteria bacterium]|nr:hypothetical protein [Alphaproteobacteria bacterium]